jgi:hypothetical protein
VTLRAGRPREHEVFASCLAGYETSSADRMISFA